MLQVNQLQAGGLLAETLGTKVAQKSSFIILLRPINFDASQNLWRCLKICKGFKITIRLIQYVQGDNTGQDDNAIR